MQSDNTQTVLLLPVDLGLAIDGDYDPVTQLDKNTAKDPLRVGDVYLQATLKEMFHIAHLCKTLEEDYRELICGTKAQYDK